MKKLLILTLLLSLSIFANAKKIERPNIIFILTDDQSFGMMRCTGNDIVQTPNLDQLASQGVLFTNAHVTSAICTPSRVSMFLSQYERKHSVNFNSATAISEEAWAQSYPVVMRNAGYYTGYIGKNHSPIGKGGYESGVIEKSVDYWYASHGAVYFYPKERKEIYKDAINDTQVEILQEGIEDFLDPNARRLQKAISFLEQRPAEKPFLLSINFNLPHGAGTSTMRQRDTDDEIYRTLYRDLDIPLPDHYIAKADIKTPRLPATLHHANDKQSSYDYVNTPEALIERYILQMQAMTGMDRCVGNLRAKLKELKLDKNTIIIFTSDHGLFMGEHGLGGKALCYEKTTHVPMIAYSPKMKRGYKSDALVQTIDIAPTILTLADVEIPEAFQGKDISGFLEGDKTEVRDYVYTENLWSTNFGNPRCEAVQNKEWKYIRYYQNDNLSALDNLALAKEFDIPMKKMIYANNEMNFANYRLWIDATIKGEKPVYEELYNLKDDPTELTNLINAKKYQAIVENLRVVWAKEIRKARGTGSPKVVIYTGK